MTVRPISEEELTARFGPREERIARHARMGRTMEFTWANMEAWRKAYPGQFVVVHDQSLVAVAKDGDDLKQKLCELAVPRNEVHIEYVRPEGSPALNPSVLRLAE